MDGYCTIQDITDKYGLSELAIRHRIRLKGIKGIKIWRKLYLDEAQVFEITSHIRNKPMWNHRRKITIIEFFMKQQCYRKVATTLNINRKYVTAAVREWFENDGYITVESKLNAK